ETMFTVIGYEPGLTYVCDPCTANLPGERATIVPGVGSVLSPQLMVVALKSAGWASVLPSENVATTVLLGSGCPLEAVRLAGLELSAASAILAVLTAVVVAPPASLIVTVTE